MSSKGYNGSYGANQNGSAASINHHVDRSVPNPVSSRQAEQTQQGGASTAALSTEASEPDSDPPDPDSRPHSRSPPLCICDPGDCSDKSQAEEEEALSPIRSALRSPGLRSNAKRHVTIVENETKPEPTLAGSNSAPQLADDGSSIRVTEQIKQGTFKDSHIIFKAGPPLADTLPKLERKEEAGSGLEAPNVEGQPVATASKATASPPVAAAANAAPLVKTGPTNEEKKKNREDRKKEKEKKKEEEMLFHHEREQEKKTKIVGTDSHNSETGEYGQWLKHAFLLGEGSYKNVYEGYNSKDGCKIAWCEYKQPFQPSTDTSEYSEKAITSESAIMKRLHHPHIVRCYDVLTSYYDIEEKRYSRYLVLIQERMEKDSLKTRIQRSFSEGRQHLSTRLIKRWMLQMLEAVSYLHKQKPMIIHRDLKPENIFMMSRESEDADDVKIGDFGLASYRDRTHKKTLAGTFGFMAPEMYGENYDEKVDIYALGMVWLEMFTNQPPFHELRGNFFLIASQTLKGKSPLSMNQVESMAFRELIMALIHPIPHWRPSAEMLQHHPLLQIKPVPIQALQHGGPEFVSNMDKNHKLHVSVRLTDKKLRTAYGLDEGQCLDVDIDLYKEQAIEKTVEELQRDIESTLAERGGEATKVTIPKKWYDNVRMQLRLFRHLLLGQRWRYLYALTYPEKGEKNEKPGEPYFGPGGLQAIFFGGTGIVSVPSGTGGGGGGSDDAQNSHIVDDFYSNSDEDGPNCFISSAKQIKNMTQINLVLERETGEKVMRHIKKAADPHAVLDSEPAPTTTTTTTVTSEDKSVPETSGQPSDRDRHPNTPPRTLSSGTTVETPATTSQPAAQPATQPATRPPQQPPSQPVQPSTQPSQPVQVTQTPVQTSHASQTQTQTVHARPAQQQSSQTPQQAPQPAVTAQPVAQPQTTQPSAVAVKPRPTWSQPHELQHPPQGYGLPIAPQHLPPGWSKLPWNPAPPPEAYPAQPMWTPQPVYGFPNWSSPNQQQGGMPAAGMVPTQSNPAPFQAPLTMPMPSKAASSEAGNQTQQQPPTPHSADHIVDSTQDPNAPMPMSMIENGQSAQPSTGHAGFVPPGNLATIGGPVSSSKGTKKKRVAGSGQSVASKKRENCKVCLTHTDNYHGVTRMHISVHLPDRPEKKVGQVMHKCSFALPINSSLKDIGKQVVDIIHDRFMKFGEHYYGPEMARCVQEEVTNIAGMYKLNQEMNLPFEVEFTGPDPQMGAQPPSTMAPTVPDIASLPKQASREEAGVTGIQETSRMSPNVTEEEGGSLNSELAANHEAMQREISALLATLPLSELRTVKEVVSGLGNLQPMVLVPEAGGGGRERRVLTVPTNCFFVAVPRKPSQPGEGYDVVKGGLGDKFVVSYPRETGMPRVWSSRSVREPVLIMPNERMYTIDRPAVLHQGPEGNIELLRLPGDDSDRLVYLRGGQAFNIEGPSVLLPGRGVFELPQPSPGAGVVVQVSDGGNYQALIQRPSMVLPATLPPGVDPPSQHPMRVVELPSNPNLEGVDFFLSMLQLLRSEIAVPHEIPEPGAVSEQAVAQDPAAAAAVAPSNNVHPDQSNNQNMGATPSERHSRAAPDKANHHPPKRKNSKEKMGGQSRGSGDIVDGQVKERCQSVSQGTQPTQSKPHPVQHVSVAPTSSQSHSIPSYPHMQTQNYQIQQPQFQSVQSYQLPVQQQQPFQQPHPITQSKPRPQPKPATSDASNQAMQQQPQAQPMLPPYYQHMQQLQQFQQLQQQYYEMSNHLAFQHMQQQQYANPQQLQQLQQAFQSVLQQHHHQQPNVMQSYHLNPSLIRPTPHQQWPVIPQPAMCPPETATNSPRKQPSDPSGETSATVPSSTSSTAIAPAATNVANGSVDAASTCPPLANGVTDTQPETTIGRFSIVTVPSSVDD